MTRKELVQELLKSLSAAYDNDPISFRTYMPKVAAILDQILGHRRQSSLNRSPFGLTERERAVRLKSLQLIQVRPGDALIREEAIKALEDVAALAEDKHLPAWADFDFLSRLLRAVLGKSVGSIRRNSELYVDGRGEENLVTFVIPIIRGVHLNLTWNMKLVSVSISPTRFKERARLMKFVGIGHDSAKDVARRHDEYFVTTIEDRLA